MTHPILRSFAILPRTYALLYDGLAQKLHLGVQLYITHAGRLIIDAALGDARPGIPMQPDSLTLWLSAGKPLTAVAIAQLWEQGKLQLDHPVALYIPPFAQHGKAAVTIRHLLTHTAGLHGLYPGPVETPWDESIARLCAGKMEPNWPPGARAGYHPFTTWSLLGEIIRRIDGRPPADYIRQEICLPLGMRDTHLALTPTQYAHYGPRMAQLMNSAHGHLTPSDLDTPAKATHSRPASSARGPIRELGYFYEMLLGRGQRRNPAGPAAPPLPPLTPRILQESTVAELTGRQRVNMLDQTFKTPIDWGLGVMLNSFHYHRTEHPYGFGPYAGPSAFGHGGTESTIALADPQNALVLAVHFNGCPGEAPHDRRNKSFFRAVYEDLGLAGT